MIFSFQEFFLEHHREYPVKMEYQNINCQKEHFLNLFYQNNYLGASQVDCYMNQDLFQHLG